MSLALYWDTETTGLKDPWLQEFAGILHNTETDQELWCARGFVTLPFGVRPEEQAFLVHNITAEECNANGISIAACCAIFWEQVALADLVVGYNFDFDLRIMRTMSLRFDVPMHEIRRVVELSNWCEHLCMLPPTGKMVKASRSNFKRPKLSEAMRILCPTYPYTAHRALPDVQACRHLHRTIKETLDAQKGEKQTYENVTAATKIAASGVAKTPQPPRTPEQSEHTPDSGVGHVGAVGSRQDNGPTLPPATSDERPLRRSDGDQEVPRGDTSRVGEQELAGNTEAGDRSQGPASDSKGEG